MKMKKNRFGILSLMVVGFVIVIIILADVGFRNVGESGLGIGILVLYIIITSSSIGLILAVVGFFEREKKLLLIIAVFLNTFCFFGFWTFGWIMRALDSIFKENIW